MTMTARRAGRFVVLVAALAVAGLAVLPAAAVTDTDSAAHDAAAAQPLGGFTLSASSSPATIQLYEQAIPIPAEPQAEVHLSYSQATASTGPSTRGLASYAWPGAAVGDGYSTIVSTLEAGFPASVQPALATLFGNSYRFQANSTYPAGPKVAEQGSDPGPHSLSHATDTGADATSTYQGSSPADAAASVRNALSTSTAKVTDTVVSATTEAKASGVTLAGGLIDIGSVDTKLTAKSDGTKGDGSGVTTVSGFTVLGQSFTVDQDGVHAAGSTVPSLLSTVLPAGNALLSALGISVTPPAVTKTVTNATAGLTASGMTISIDTTQLNTVLSNPAVSQVIVTIAGALPEKHLSEAVYALQTAAPKTVYVIGDASISASASPAFDFNGGGTFGPSVAPSTPVQASVPAGGSSGSAGGAGGGVIPPPNAGTGIDTGAPSPAVAEPPPLASSGNSITLPGGKSVPAGLVVGALVLAGVLGWALRWFALGALGAGGAGCDLGAPVGVPDLRNE